MSSTDRVEMLVQEDVNSGVGAMVGAITWVMDPDRMPPPSTLTAITPGRPFPAVQEYVLSVR